MRLSSDGRIPEHGWEMDGRGFLRKPEADFSLKSLFFVKPSLNTRSGMVPEWVAL
jgi:hypothetical protein